MRDEESDRLVTIRRFRNVPDADLARAVLATRGVQAVLADVHARTLIPHLIHEVRLQVMLSDAGRAIEILQQESKEHPSLKGPIARLRQCPDCGSYDVSREPLACALAILCGLLLGLPFLIMKAHWHCHTCDCRWKV